jgi:multisubunit Na+/H+ antiporter MnhE subunit
MTAQDYITIYWEAQHAGISSVTLYISILSGYLIVFYSAGAKLSTMQSIFITMLFVVFSTVPTWAVYEYFSAAMEAASAMEKTFLFNRIDINPAIVLVPLMVAGIVGCLNFAWDTRKPK